MKKIILFSFLLISSLYSMENDNQIILEINNIAEINNTAKVKLKKCSNCIGNCIIESMKCCCSFLGIFVETMFIRNESVAFQIQNRFARGEQEQEIENNRTKNEEMYSDHSGKTNKDE